MTFTEAVRLVNRATAPEDLFGKNPDAEVMKRAYRKMAALLHPDKVKDPKSKKKATEAFAKLTDWYERAEHKLSNGTYGDAKALSKPVVITTKKATYMITQRLASGDLSEVYAARDHDGNALVLKVPRSPVNNDLMKNEADRLKWMWNEAPTKGLKAMAHIPVLADSFDLQQGGGVRKRVNVLARLDGYVTLADVLQAYPKGIHWLDAAWMFNRMLGALLIAHQADIVHGAVIPTNMMICPEHPAAHNGVLIDWTASVHAKDVIKIISGPYKDYYPPEVMAKKPATFGTDVYMAAMCYLALLGGNVATRAFPDGTHPRLKGLFRACWLGAAHRTQDVYELYKEFGVLTGPRRFRPFAMPADWKK